MVLIIQGNDTRRREFLPFPSPYGDYGSYQSLKKYLTYYNYCFRPLTGIMVLIMSYDDYVCNDYDGCFRPLTGIMVLITKSQQLSRTTKGGFRPLTGIMVLIRKVCC